MKKRVESVCLPVYAQTSHTTITQAYPDAAPRGTSATCGRRTCCSHPPRGSPRVWKSGSRPHKNVQTILYAVPLSGEAGKGMAGDHQAFPPAMAHLEPQQSRGDQPFPSHPGSLVAGGNTKILFPQACRICLVFVLLSPAAFLAVVP